MTRVMAVQDRMNGARPGSRAGPGVLGASRLLAAELDCLLPAHVGSPNLGLTQAERFGVILHSIAERLGDLSMLIQQTSLSLLVAVTDWGDKLCSPGQRRLRQNFLIYWPAEIRWGA